MEEELRCFHCNAFYHVPILLGCHHALCLTCAIALQKPCNIKNQLIENVSVAGSEESEADKVSVLSDADSGVSCSSRPTSLVSATEGSGQSVSSPSSYFIKCPRCGVNTVTDDTGGDGLPRFRVLAAVVDKHLERFKVSELCQLCDDSEDHKEGALPAQFFCDQCLVFYCPPCKESFHPARGPLANHWLVSVSEGRALLRARRREREGKCSLHVAESVSMYCVTCQQPVCILCLQNGLHQSHDVHALNALTKAYKTDLSHSLQQLSEKAKQATDFIHTLKTLTEDVQGNCKEVEAVLVTQIDALIEILQQKRSQLISWVRGQRDTKVRILRSQAQEYTHSLQSTTATIHFCIEALKEADPTAFMEARHVLEDRITSLSTSFSEVVSPEPRAEPDLDLTLDEKSLLNAINQLTFLQLKNPKKEIKPVLKRGDPECPTFNSEECCAERNLVTVSWTPHHNSATTGFLLEIDDGLNGPFREVYSGEETVCTIDGLHFNSIYRVRIRGFNDAGISSYSDTISLQTDKATFCLESGHPDLLLSSDSCTIECDSYEHRVALGTMNFSRGDHYWEFVLERYDGNADISFGVATGGVFMEKILGHCSESWGIYIDKERSWLMHAGEHFSRVQGGIQTDDVFGVLLSFTHRILIFYLNQVPKDSMRLDTISNQVLHPAVSLNRSVTLSLRTGLEFPQHFLETYPPETFI